MRNIHRWLSVLAGMFLLVIAATGVYLQSDILLEHYIPGGPDMQPLSTYEIPRLLANALMAIRRSAPGTQVSFVELSMRGGIPRLDIAFANGRWQSFDARNGEPLADSAGGGPQASLRLQLRTVALQLHRGAIVGVAGSWLGWLCGLALMTLATTGLFLYFRLYRQRLKQRRRSLFW